MGVLGWFGDFIGLAICLAAIFAFLGLLIGEGMAYRIYRRTGSRDKKVRASWHTAGIRSGIMAAIITAAVMAFLNQG